MKQKKYTYALIGFAFLSATVTSHHSSAQGIQLAPSLSISAGSNTGTSGTVQAGYIVAIVNSEPITNNEVRARLIRYERRYAEQSTGMPSRPDLSRQILEDIIRERLQLKLARETGVRVDERAVDAALQNFAAENNMSLNDLSNRRSADGVGLAQIRADIKNQLLIQKLREREVMSSINIPDEDIDSFIKEQLGSEQITDLNIDLAQILISIPENANEAKVQASLDRATRLLTRARNGEDFFKLALENSDAKDANTGGQMGLKSVDRYPTLFAEATQGLKEGDFAGPIRSGAGFHILKVLTKQLPNQTSYAITQTNAKHILLRTTATLTETMAKESLAALKKRIDSATISFETAAKEFSQDGSAISGGDLGWANPGQFVPEFEDVMRLLPAGKVSDPIVTRFGVHLLLVQDRRKALLSNAEQRELARNALRQKKFETVYNNWLNELRSNAYVEYRELQQ